MSALPKNQKTVSWSRGGLKALLLGWVPQNWWPAELATTHVQETLG